jgi:hypothetical protein
MLVFHHLESYSKLAFGYQFQVISYKQAKDVTCFILHINSTIYFSISGSPSVLQSAMTMLDPADMRNSEGADRLQMTAERSSITGWLVGRAASQ